MCRSIKPLFNFEPPASESDVRAASLQFVRKLAGFSKPSAANEAAFERAVEEIASSASRMLDSLVTAAAPHDRAAWEAKAKARSVERFAQPRR